jgi:prepilin-type N-terminal cleavage/methylation domain-containing protein
MRPHIPAVTVGVGSLRAGNNSRQSAGNCLYRKDPGFTLLELIIVLFLMTLIMGMATLFFANVLPSNRLNATVRSVSATIREARSLARINGVSQVVTIDFDSNQYGIEGRGAREFPDGISVKVIDPAAGEVRQGKYQFIFHPSGGIEGGTIVLGNGKKVIAIQPDPVAGSVVIK